MWPKALGGGAPSPAACPLPRTTGPHQAQPSTETLGKHSTWRGGGGDLRGRLPGGGGIQLSEGEAGWYPGEPAQGLRWCEGPGIPSYPPASPQPQRREPSTPHAPSQEESGAGRVPRPGVLWRNLDSPTLWLLSQAHGRTPITAPSGSGSEGRKPNPGASAPEHPTPTST